jgi:hypothetical protein
MDTHPHNSNNSGATNSKKERKKKKLWARQLRLRVTLLAFFARTQMRTDGCPTWPPLLNLDPRTSSLQPENHTPSHHFPLATCERCAIGLALSETAVQPRAVYI